MRALTLPTSVYAAPEDWGTTELGMRIERAATELAVMVRAGVEQQIADRAWSSYQHPFAGNATRAERTAADLDFDSPFMRLAAGGRQAPPERVRPDSATRKTNHPNGRLRDDRST
jgi:FMN reductase